MITDRRNLLRMFPLAGVALPAAKLLGDEAAVGVESVEMMPVKEPEAQKCRPLFVIKVNVPVSEEWLVALRESFRSGMERFGFADIPAIVMPSYCDMSVFSIPITEGEVKCSGSEQSKSV